MLILPHEATLTGLTLHWPVAGTTPLTPRRLTVQGLRAGQWVDLAVLQREQAEPASRVECTAGPAIAAVRLTQTPDHAHPAADRRLCLARIELEGARAEPPVVVGVARVAAQCRTELQALRQREDTGRAAAALAVVMQQPKPHGFMGIIDRADLERGRRNVATRGWAKSLAENIRKDADWWLTQSDETLYGLVPSGNPRALCPQFEKGCPLHGGARNSFTATLEKPFVWRCTKGGEEWYDGAVIKHPQSGSEITIRDTGDGWLAPAGFPAPGRRYYFVAAYRYFLIGKLFGSVYEGDGGSRYQGGPAALQLALAYAISGDARYAHKAAVLLNRLAELYRTYDGCIEGPSQRQDGYIGQTFERFTVQQLCLAVDLIWDEVAKDGELHAFFAGKGGTDYAGDGQVSGADFTYNLQRNLLGFFYEYLHRLMPYMDGDFVMYEMTALAAVARVLGNADILAEALDSDLGLGVLLRNSWFRDGRFIYDSTGYNVGNAQTPLLIAEWLHGMSAPPRYPSALDLYHDPAYRMSMLFAFLRAVDCDGRPPQIGDCGGSRAPVLRSLPPYDTNEERAFLRLPEQRPFYGSRLLAASGGDLEAFRAGRADWWLLFHAEETPSLAAGAAAGTVSASHLFDDSGIAILRGGRRPADRQHVCLTFSKGSYGHGHGDKLALNLIRYGYDLTADLGYPTTWTDLKYQGWETHTASHCTVMLDGSAQTGNVCGRLHLYACSAPADVVEASAEDAYPGASLYRRTSALVRNGQGEVLYTADIFRTAGTASRDYLFHGLGRPEELTVTLADPKATWTPQEEGSLAGVDIVPMSRPGLSFLHALQRARTDAGLAAHWQPVLGSEQPDRYLLTRQHFREVVVEFTMVRTGKAAGPRCRATFVYGVPPTPGAPDNRRVIWLDAGSDGLPVGQPVRVRIEISGPTAGVSFDGTPASRGVDVAGNPVDDGALGFLHYYNYAYEYRDLVLTPTEGAALRVDLERELDPAFWRQIDPTYHAATGCLSARDAQTPGMHLYLLGAPGRELIRAQAEGHGVRGNSPMEGHLIVRETASDPARTSIFAGVIETTLNAPPRLQSAAPVSVAPGQEQAWHERAGIAMRVDCVAGPDGDGARTDYLFSALRDDAGFVFASTAGEIRFQGRFGLLTTRGREVTSLFLVGSGHLSCAGRQLVLPAPVRGLITAIEPARDAILVRLDPGSAVPTDAVGRRLLVSHPAFVCPAVYTVEQVEQADADRWRLLLNQPLAVASGEVGSVDPAKGAFATTTPIMKLRVNPRLFDGKHVLAHGAGTTQRLQTAAEDAFVLATPTGLADFAAGARFTVYDIGVDDPIEIVPHGEVH